MSSDAEMERMRSSLLAGSRPTLSALHTDMYQVTMAYAYFCHGRHEEHSAFDLFFRKNPFGGEFTVFAGLAEVVRFLNNFRFTAEEVEYLRGTLGPSVSEEFYEHLLTLDCSKLTVNGIKEGTVVFPRVPLLRIEGPLLLCQLVETTLLNLVNYASLMATNAARFRMVARAGTTLLEFGLRRAQGPDGGLSASRYSYIGGFDATSNVEAGRQFGIPVKGTHAHAFVQSFIGFEQLGVQALKAATADGEGCDDFAQLCRDWLARILKKRESFTTVLPPTTNLSELAAFCGYALAFPTSFLALIDTYDTLRSGAPNFMAVALALKQLGYSPAGVRIDSGDLSYISLEVRRFMREVEAAFPVEGQGVGALGITASNDIHEGVLVSLEEHGHAITSFGIGTHLVTCLAQPALGCVYKLVEVMGTPRIKLSEDIAKVTIPGRKQAYRLYGKDGIPILDLMLSEGDAAPEPGKRILCRHPFVERKRAYVIPSKVEPLYDEVWGANGAKVEALNDIHQARAWCLEQLKTMRPDHLRRLNPTPYKVSVSEGLYNFIHELWLSEAPVGELE